MFIRCLFALLILFPCFPMRSHELVNIQTIDPCIGVCLKADHYLPLTKAYLVRHVAKQLSLVQKELEKDSINLVVFDAYRPFSFANLFEIPYSFSPDECNPIVNGHYRGTAVDVTLIYQSGLPLEMPPFLNIYDLTELGTDYFGFSCVAYHNMQKLQKAMQKHRFVPSETEWWHFDYKDWFQYPVLDIPFESLN